jgi:hypothetical protein
MTRYRISQGGEPVAIVNGLDLVRGIARGQPPGYYSVDELPVNPPVAAGHAAVRRWVIRHRDGREPGTQSGRKIEQSHRFCTSDQEAGGESAWQLEDDIMSMTPG